MSDLSYQKRIDLWLNDCIGEADARNKTERNHRFLEEALELVQACGCTKEECLHLVDYVFGRPVGDIGQEIGGVMNTLAALSTAHDLALEDEAEIELTRCWEKIEKIRVKHANKPKFSALPQ